VFCAITHNSGLDNAGKTTIVKQIMNEDVTTVSPTLGFIIKTIDFQGYKRSYSEIAVDLADILNRYKLNICKNLNILEV
jgi:GTPase SAR1 family protein